MKSPWRMSLHYPDGELECTIVFRKPNWLQRRIWRILLGWKIVVNKNEN